MPDAPASLYLDEDVSVVVAAILRARGFDVQTAREAGQLGRSDLEQLGDGAVAKHVLLTPTGSTLSGCIRSGWKLGDHTLGSSLPAPSPPCGTGSKDRAIAYPPNR